MRCIYTAICSQSDFVALRPIGFGADYAEHSAALWIDPNVRELRDYAIIMRHTDDVDGTGQVSFALAGFTEHGTTFAGYYLAENFDSLYERFVSGKANSALGDFLLVIAGPSSWSTSAKGWREDNLLPAITPARLHSKRIDCVWSRRIGPLPNASVDAPIPD
jgi:hypothetical protein